MIQTISSPTFRKRQWKRKGETVIAWQVDFTVKTDGELARVRRQFSTRKKCEDFYAQAASEVGHREYGLPRRRPSTITLPDFVKAFESHAALDIRPSSMEQVRLTGKWLTAFLGASKLVKDVTEKDLNAYKAHRIARGRGPWTLKREVTTIRRMMRMAVKWGYAKTDPAVDIRAPRPVEGDVVYLEVEDQIKLIDAARAYSSRSTLAPCMLPLIVLALHSGMRKSELLNLRWDQIDLERRTIYVKNTGTFLTKSGRNRIIGLSENALEQLKAWKDWFPRAIQDATEKSNNLRLYPRFRLEAAERVRILKRCRPKPHRLIFPSFRKADASGEAAPLDNVRRSWAAILRKAFGSEVEKPNGKTSIVVPGRYQIGLHALRHTFAVTLARQGVPLTKLSSALGHTSLRTTQIYLRFYPDEGRDLADKLPSIVTNPAHGESGAPATPNTPPAQVVDMQH